MVLHSHCAGVSGFWGGFGKIKNLGCMCVNGVVPILWVNQMKRYLQYHVETQKKHKHFRTAVDAVPASW